MMCTAGPFNFELHWLTFWIAGCRAIPLMKINRDRELTAIKRAFPYCARKPSAVYEADNIKPKSSQSLLKR
jgi:hypothetical protein